MSATTRIKLPEAPSSGRIAELVREMIAELGEDPNREGLRQTPERFEEGVARYLTSGYQRRCR